MAAATTAANEQHYVDMGASSVQTSTAAKKAGRKWTDLCFCFDRADPCNRISWVSFGAISCTSALSVAFGINAALSSENRLLKEGLSLFFFLFTVGLSCARARNRL